jgi:hypothetical protein
MRLNVKKRLLIIDFLEKYKYFSKEEVCIILSIKEKTLNDLLKKGFIIIPSKINLKKSCIKRKYF